MPSTRNLARTALGATLFLIMLGAYTRGSGSGFGCADRWPLCEDGLLGGLLPRLEYHMLVEWTHRWVAAIVGLLILTTVVSALRNRPRRARVTWPAAAALVVVGIQAWLGRMVVKGDLDKDLVALHLSVSITVAALLALVLIGGERRDPAGVSPRDAVLVGIGAIVAYATLLFGSLAHNIYVEGWPLVRNEVFPDLSNRFVALHFVHRVVAGAGAVYIGWLAWKWRDRHQRALVWTAAGGVATNVVLGLVHVLTKVTSATVVALHVIVAATVWVVLVAATARASGYAEDVEPVSSVAVGE